MRKLPLAAVIVLLLAASACGASEPKAASTGISTSRPASLVFNRSISTIRIGESFSRVNYEWGIGKSEGATLMDENSFNARGEMYRYALKRGHYLRVGFYKRKVVYLETNSPDYKTSDDIGVGYRIAYGKKTVLDGSTFHYTGPVCGCWYTVTRNVRYPKSAKYAPANPAFQHWVQAVSHIGMTYLTMDKGRVSYIFVERGDVNNQW